MIELKQSDNLFAGSEEEKSSLQEFSFPAANNIVSRAENPCVTREGDTHESNGRILKQVEAVQGKEEKVLIVTGKPGSGKSKLLREAAEAKGWDYVDTRLLITEEFLKLLPSERKEQAPAMLTEELSGHRGDVILLDRVQTLFVPVFHIDPKSVIDALGKAYTVVLAWPGYVNDGLLCYDKFDGTESIRISAADYTVWEVE